MKRYNCRKAGLTGLVCLGVCVCAALAQSPAPEREYYKYYYKTKIPFIISTQKIAVIFEDGAIETQKQGVAGAEAAIARLAECRDASGRVQMAELKPGLAKADVETLIQRAANQPGVRFATPVLVSQRGGEFVPNGGVIVKFAKDVTDAEIGAVNGEYGAAISYQFPGITPQDSSREYVLRVPNPKQNNPLDVANRYAENPRVLWAEPDGYDLSMKAGYRPDDPYFPYDPNNPSKPYQWNLKQDSNHDIDADEAWDIQTGSSNIVIALIDSGCCLEHPDLNFWTSPGGAHGYDYLNMDFDPSDTFGHGTKCAGIAAARTNNGEGVAGICWGASVMALRIFDGWNFALLSDIARAINYANFYGADVLSNSWYSTDLQSQSAAVDQAIANAKTGGRGGKGCVVVFCSGNNGTSPVPWPGNLKTVIAVGATDQSDKWYGGNYGSELDLTAPSGVPTTKMPPEMYEDSMAGTSAACPHVAGAAALLIAQDSNLTANQVQAILEFSAQDHAAAPVDPNDTDGRDYRYGYGRLNARKALELAQEPRTQSNGSNGLHKASFYNTSGHLVVEDMVMGPLDSPPPDYLTPSVTDIWVLRNNTPEVIARLTSTGRLYVKTSWAEKQTSLTPPSGSPLVIRDNSSAPVAYIDLSGNLCVKGRIFMGNNPDRQSSQGK